MAVVMIMAVAMVRVPMPAQDDKDESIDQDPHQCQNEHDCTPRSRGHALLFSPVADSGRRMIDVWLIMSAGYYTLRMVARHSWQREIHDMISLIEGVLLPLTGVGLMTLLTASYSRMPVTSHVLRTDARAPKTSILWYLQEAS